MGLELWFMNYGLWIMDPFQLFFQWSNTKFPDFQFCLTSERILTKRQFLDFQLVTSTSDQFFTKVFIQNSFTESTKCNSVQFCKIMIDNKISNPKFKTS